MRTMGRVDTTSKQTFGSKHRLGDLLAATSVCALCMVLIGCGGSSKRAPATQRDTGATARFVIHWPGDATRAIPAQTNRILLFINGPTVKGTVAYAVDKPTFGNTTTVTVPVPAGDKLIFSAEARKVPQPKYYKPERLQMDSPELDEGELLGAGNDKRAHNVALFQTIQVEIIIEEAAQPHPGTTQVTITVNQVLTATFPSVLVLEVIRDQDGNPIKDLNKLNFEVIEDGVPAVITDVRTVEQAAQDLSVMLVLDRSGSMGGQPNADLETAASTFVSYLNPEDAAAVINFSSFGNVVLSQAFTTDKSLLLAAIQNKVADGSTALWKAALLGVNTTAARAGRKAVLLMTDGQDNDSGGITAAHVVNAAKSAALPIFTIGLGDVDPSLSAVATQTGGIHYVAPSSSQLQEIYTRISNQLAAQIQISFISPDPVASGRLRHLIVRFRYGNLTGESFYQYRM